MLPLKGIRILDFSLAMMAPLSTVMLGDMGAEVIKVERIQGEEIRKGRAAGSDGMYSPEQLQKMRAEDTVIPDNARWMVSNRNKKSMAIDVRKPEGKDIVMKLVKDVDVVVHNFRPGTMDKLGLGYKDMTVVNPKVIYCVVYGFGATGPLAHRIGGDLYAQAMTGMVSQMGGGSVPPTNIPFFLIDHAGAMMTSYAIVLALLHRQRTGEGQEVSLNQTDVGMWLQASQLGEYLVNGKIDEKTGRGGQDVPNGTFQTRDGAIATWFAAGAFWAPFCKAIGLEDLVNDPRFENDKVRRENMDELYAILDPFFLTKTREEWQQIFRKAKLRVDPCLTYQELCAPHPQVVANEGIATINHPIQGAMRVLGVPVKLSKTPGKPQSHPPLLGEHTKEIMTGLGYGAEEISRLEESKVIKSYQEEKEK